MAMGDQADKRKRKRSHGMEMGGLADESSYLSSFFTPENVTMLVSLVGASIGITTTAIKGIQTWVDERKSRKIRIKYKDTELEISGAQSEADIEKALLHFSKLKEKINEEDVKIEVVK